MNRPLRIALIATATVVVLAVGAGGVFLASFDPNTLKPRIIEAVKRATGRDLALNGKIALEFALRPTIRVDDVAFANPPGFSRPDMARLQSLELELGLLPLLSRRIEIDRLVLVHPDILLERTADGQSNWQLTPEHKPEAAPSTPAEPTTPQAPTEPTTVSVDTIRIQDGTLAYRDDATGKLTTLQVPSLQATSASPDSPLHLDANALYNNTPFTLVADTGSLARLQQPTATTPWPAKLTFAAAGATLAAEGAFTQPLQAKGYNLSVTAAVPDAAALAPLLQGIAPPPPPLRDIRFTAKLADTGAPNPDISAVTLHVGPSDLSARIPGLSLTRLDIDAPRPDQPMKIDLAATLGATAVAMTGTIGVPAQALPNAAPSPYPMDVTLQADGATATAKGTVANPQALSGLNLALTATIPDLAALSPLAGRPLPPLKTIAFQGTLTDPEGGLRHGATLHDFHLTGPDGDLSGTTAIALAAEGAFTQPLQAKG
ncbi:MAG TPA: AsmA family protein, partial [Rhodopila sp.]|nr:AsmA family protein [Rhodopila sp.]